MVNVLLVFICVLPYLQDAPYKPKAEFEVKIDMQFKARNPPQTQGTEVPLYQLDKTKDKVNGALQPFVFLNVVLLEVHADEVRCKATLNKLSTVYNKKVKAGTVINLEVGFTDEIKEKMQSKTFDLTFLDDKKAASSRVVITIDRDGLYLINGQKTGKF